MKLPSLNLLALAAIAGLLFALSCERDRLAEEKLDRHNAEAAADTSRLVYHSKTLTVHERLAFQQTQNIELSGELKQALQADGEKTQTLVRLTVELDSLHRVLGTGQVTASTADSTVRELVASIDTAGFRATVNASVPRPPATASVFWTIHRDPVAVIAALNRDADGRLALRAASPDASAQIRIDTVRVRVEAGLHQTQSLALKLGLLIAAFIGGRASK